MHRCKLRQIKRGQLHFAQSNSLPDSALAGVLPTGLGARIGGVIIMVALLMSLLAPRAHAEDSSLDLTPYAGKVVYLDFWASWCTPCRASFPFMHDLVEEFGEDLHVIAVNLDKKRELADDFLADFDVNFAIKYDPEGVLAKEFKLKAMPTSILFDRSGEAVAQHLGFRKSDVIKLRTAIRAQIER